MKRAAPRSRARPRPDGRTSRYRIQALDRAAAVLDCFVVDRPELNVRDIAEKTGLHKSTAHRILMALHHNGLVEQDESSRYHLGLQLVKLGEHALQRLDVRVVARPHLEELAAQGKETVHLAVMDGDQVVMIDRVDGPHALGTPSLPGRLFPIIRKRGYATAEEELEVGLCTVGSVVRGHSGAVVAAVSISGPSARLRAATLATQGELVKKAAARISAQLGYGRPS